MGVAVSNTGSSNSLSTECQWDWYIENKIPQCQKFFNLAVGICAFGVVILLAGFIFADGLHSLQGEITVSFGSAITLIGAWFYRQYFNVKQEVDRLIEYCHRIFTLLQKKIDTILPANEVKKINEELAKAEHAGNAIIYPK